MSTTDFAVGLPEYARRPPVRRLPPLGGRRRRWRALGDLFLFRFLFALPESPLEALGALVEPLRKAWLFLVRLWAGPGMRGGWGSDAGRLVLAVHAAYWTRDALRTDEADCRVGVAGGSVTVRAEWVPEGEAAGAAHTGVRATPWPRATRRRVDIGFPDGSWLTVRARRPEAADRLRALLVAGSAAAGAAGEDVRVDGERSHI
ncbi:hypothetical protein [Streptomyces sp. NPDC056049]|uniref:hypothetical protein n=1 Tax=Streptomyces sp. NPDC056049 TaxID=3345693 RepID=UPI0035DA9F87